MIYCWRLRLVELNDLRPAKAKRLPTSHIGNENFIGDPARETYRLSTFHQYPRDVPIDPRQFAANGFYYTGYQDRVKCFS